MAAHDKEGEEPKEAISAHSWKTRKADVLDATMSYNEAYQMFETWCGPPRAALCLRCCVCQCAEALLRRVSSHTKDADFNAQRFAKEWEAITYDTEVRTNPPTSQVCVRVPRDGTVADSGVAPQVVITPHPLNVETEMTLAEFAELLSRVGLIKTKSLKKSHTKGERVEDFLHGENPATLLRSDISRSRLRAGVWMRRILPQGQPDDASQGQVFGGGDAGAVRDQQLHVSARTPQLLFVGVLLSHACACSAHSDELE